jgi:hypothetical protein
MVHSSCRILKKLGSVTISVLVTYIDWMNSTMLLSTWMFSLKDWLILRWVSVGMRPMSLETSCTLYSYTWLLRAMLRTVRAPYAHTLYPPNVCWKLMYVLFTRNTSTTVQMLSINSK